MIHLNGVIIGWRQLSIKVAAANAADDGEREAGKLKIKPIKNISKEMDTAFQKQKSFYVPSHKWFLEYGSIVHHFLKVLCMILLLIII